MTPFIRERLDLAAPAPRAVRQAEGIFYTPPLVAEFIVDRALRAWRSGLESQGIARPSSPRILDPACGDGAFLTAALRKLNVGEREAIRLFGVDTDARAAAQARDAIRSGLRSSSSSSSTIEDQIRVGDFLDDATLDGWAPFDLIVANPPYRRERGHKARMDAIAATRLGKAHRSARMDLWHYFAHRALETLAPSGALGMIVNSYWTASAGAAKLTDALRSRVRIVEIYDLVDMRIFEGVGGRHLILIARDGSSGDASNATTRVYAPTERSKNNPAAFFAGDWTMIERPADSLFRGGGVRIAPAVLSAKAERKMIPLGSLGRIRQGIAENPSSINRRTNARYGDRWTTGEGVFVLRPEELGRLDLPEAERTLLRPYYALGDLDRYSLAETPSLILIYAAKTTWPADRPDAYPNLRRHLERFRPILEERRETKLGRIAWHHLHWPRDEAIWQAPRKLLCKQMAARPCFAIADGPAYVSFSVNVFVPDDQSGERISLDYVLGWLNSQVMEDWFRREAKLRGAGPEINGHVLARAPIPGVDFADPRQRSSHNEMAAWSQRLSELHRRRKNSPARSDEAEVRELEARINEWAARRV